MDSIDRRIVNHLQEGLPVCTRPFDDVAAQLELPVDELLARLQRLLSKACSLSPSRSAATQKRQGGIRLNASR